MRYAQINWNKLPMQGWGGLITMIAVVVLFAVGLPRLFVQWLPIMALGVLGGLAAYWWRNR